MVKHLGRKVFDMKQDKLVEQTCSAIDIEKFADEFFEFPDESNKQYVTYISAKLFAEAYHKAKCEQSEDVARVQYDMSVEWNPKLKEDLPAGTKLYTTQPDQSSEIERLKAREARLLEAAKKFEDLYDYTGDDLVCFAAGHLYNVIKEIESELVSLRKAEK